MTESHYCPELDVLRCIAFLFVFFNLSTDRAPIDRAAHPLLHALSRVGWYGVPVFFLLSAFLIAIACPWIAGYAWRAEPGFSSQWTNSFVQFQFFATGALLAPFRDPVHGRLAADPRRQHADAARPAGHAGEAAALDARVSGPISCGPYMLHAMAVFLLFNVRNEWLTRLCERLPLADWRNLAAACLALGLTVAAAMLSCRFLERPFLRMKRRHTLVPW